MATRPPPLALRFLAFAALLILAALETRRANLTVPADAPDSSPAGPTFAEVCDHIEPGMAESEVEGLCGGASELSVAEAGGSGSGKPTCAKRWDLAEGHLWVRFDHEGTVVSKTFLPRTGARKRGG
jgi:hypothetical protein